jgi:hypothetical protein
MVKVLTKATSGSDLLSFLKDQNWGTPGDRRRNPRWDLLHLHQHEAHARGPERSEIPGQSQNGGKDPLVREETEHGTGKAGTRRRMQGHDTLTEGSEIEMLGEGEEAAGTETTNTSPSFQEVEAKLSSEEESPEVPFRSEEETEIIDESDDQFKEEGILEALPPLPSLAMEDQEQQRKRGRTRQRTRGAVRVRETKTLLASRTYCSHAKMQRDIKSLLHLGPSGRDEELSFRTFDKCTDSRGCGSQGGPADTVDRCEGCTVRLTGSGFSPCLTGTRLRCFKTL